MFIGALGFLYSPDKKVNKPFVIPEKQQTYVLQSKYSQLSMGLAPASVCAQVCVCVCVLGCSSFCQLRIKIEGMREQYGSSIINSVDARRRAEWIVCAFAVYNSASPRARSRGDGAQPGGPPNTLKPAITSLWYHRHSRAIQIGACSAARTFFIHLACADSFWLLHWINVTAPPQQLRSCRKVRAEINGVGHPPSIKMSIRSWCSDVCRPVPEMRCVSM